MAQFTDTDMPVDLVLIRHGESEGNLSDDLGKKGKKLGKSEMAEQLQSKIHGIHTSEWRLTDLGRHQAGRAGELVRREILGQNGGAGVVGAFDTGFCSSYARAMETAACLAIPNTKFFVNILLREKESDREWIRSGMAHPGARENAHTTAHVEGEFYGDASGMESPADLMIRVRLFLSQLRQHYAGQRVVVVCHKNVIKAFRLTLAGVHPAEFEAAWKENPPNCGVEWYTRREADGVVRSHFRRLIMLNLREPSDGAATHSEADVSEQELHGGRLDHGMTAADLLEAVGRFPQKLNNADMAALLAAPSAAAPAPAAAAAAAGGGEAAK